MPNEISEMREGESLEREKERYIGFLVLAKLVLNGLVPYMRHERAGCMGMRGACLDQSKEKEPEKYHYLARFMDQRIKLRNGMLGGECYCACAWRAC